MHLIDLSNHRANMAFIGETPWHGLGQKLTENAPIDIWAEQAGMSHQLNTSSVVFRWGENRGEVGTFDGQNVLWRSDTKQALSTVSNGYKIVQPRDVLEFFRDLVDATGEYQLDTAGVLDGGRKYWALARHRTQFNFGSDTVLPYLMLATSCDGSMATIAQHTSVRVVCNNTLQMSLGDARDAVKITHRSVFDADRVRAQLGVDTAMASFVDGIDALIDKTLSQAQSVEILVELVSKRDATGEITNEKATKRVVSAIMRDLHSGPGARLESAQGTAWGLVNAVTHYVDFNARARNTNNRFSSSQFGRGADMKRDVINLIHAA